MIRTLTEPKRRAVRANVRFTKNPLYNVKRGYTLRKAVFVIEILVLALVLGGLYYYVQFKSRLETIIETPEATVNDEGVLQSEPLKNEDVEELKGYKTIALFGIDHRDTNEALDGENSDTMIVASISFDTHEIRLVSIYRDTLLNIGDDIYAKANSAYAYGGAKQAITMLNTCLDLDISEYVTIDFRALAAAVDALDGLDIPLSYAEIVHMNNYCIETAEETGRDYTPVPTPFAEPPEDQEAIVGTYHLNGVQVTSYCRIRYTANLDMGRTERQRRVIQMLVSKAKGAGLTKAFEVMDEVFPMVKTNMTITEILSLAPALITYDIGQTTGFPMEYRFAEIRGSVIVATDLLSNVTELHNFLYGDSYYMPTPEVTERNNVINTLVNGAENAQDQLPEIDSGTGENPDDNNFYWQPDDSGSYNYYTGDSSGTGSGSYDSSYSGTGYVDYNTGTGTTAYDTGTAGYDAGTTTYDTGTTDYGTGTTTYDTGTTDYGTGTSTYDTGTAGYGAGTLESGGGTDSYTGDELTSVP